jgi:hemerythrin-like domain-containing protein
MAKAKKVTGTAQRTSTRATTAGAQKVRRSGGPSAPPSKAMDAAAPSSDTRGGALAATAEAIGRTLGRTTAVIAGRLHGKDDGLTLLERDHRVLESILKEGVDADEQSGADRKAILARLAHELTTHELMEEKVLYPALKSHSEARDIVLEGYQEHHVADLLMKELEKLPPSDERWGAKLQVLKENIEHHIEEEEGDMFKLARTLMSEEQLEELGVRMRELKDQAQGRADAD